MTKILVIGATGDVGRGIVAALLEDGHQVGAMARSADRLDALAQEFGRPTELITIPGSFDTDKAAIQARDAAVAVLGTPTDVVVSINGARHLRPLLDNSTDEFKGLLEADLITHFTSARALIPVLAENGSYIGIGGGSADFILQDGAYMSVAQAGLRMFYRGLAHEMGDRPIHVHALIIASVVNGATTRAVADPLWVTDVEIGQQVAVMLATPHRFDGPIWRLSRRDESGRPVLTYEGATRVQGIRASTEAPIPV